MKRKRHTAIIGDTKRPLKKRFLIVHENSFSSDSSKCSSSKKTQTSQKQSNCLHITDVVILKEYPQSKADQQQTSVIPPTTVRSIWRQLTEFVLEDAFWQTFSAQRKELLQWPMFDQRCWHHRKCRRILSLFHSKMDFQVNKEIPFNYFFRKLYYHKGEPFIKHTSHLTEHRI